jgi:hypothetical protein
VYKRGVLVENQGVRTFKRAVSQISFAWLVMFALLVICGCTRKGSSKSQNLSQSEELRPEEPLESLTAAPAKVDAPQSENFLHKVFSVNNHAEFAFVVPARQENTRLHGDFRSFTKLGDPDSTSDKSADVDLILLNEHEFNDFLHGQPQSVIYELDSTHNQIVDWRVPTTYSDPQTYHLVFSNSGSGTKTKFVKADFTISFR